MKKRFAILVLALLLSILGLSSAFADADTIDSRQELFDYIWAQVPQRPTSLKLPPATAWGIDDYLEQIGEVLFRSGVNSYRCSYDPSGRKGVTLDPLQWNTDPIYLCTSQSEIIAAMKTAREKKQAAFSLYASDAVIDRLFEDDFATLYQMLLQAGYAIQTNYRYSPGNSVHIFAPVYTTAPSRSVDTETELVEALRGMYQGKHQEFYLLLSRTLADAIEADPQLINRLHSKALVIDSDCTIYAGIRALHYTSLECEENARVLSTVDEAMDYLADAVTNNLAEVWLFCTPGLMETLTTLVPLGGESVSTLELLGNQVGLMNFNTTIYRDANKLKLHTMTISPARRILNAVRSNDYASLTTRELRLLNVALDIVSRTDADTPAAYLWQLQAALAEYITYTINPNTDDDDCAFGALLDGEANCDGYADAFDLCAGLAGFDTMMVTGYSNEPDTGESTGHAWNLVKVYGQWYFVDATWADGSVLRPMYFLLGLDRAPLFYLWAEHLYPTLAASTMTGQTPYVDLAFTTLEELADYLSFFDTAELGEVSVYMPAMTLHADEATSDKIQQILQDTAYHHAYTMDHGLLLTY